MKREMKEAVAAATESAMIPSAEFRRLEADLEEARAGMLLLGFKFSSLIHTFVFRFVALEKEQLARAGAEKRKKALEDELDDLKDQVSRINCSLRIFLISSFFIARGGICCQRASDQGQTCR